jgi:glutathione S-transferase
MTVDLPQINRSARAGARAEHIEAFSPFGRMSFGRIAVDQRSVVHFRGSSQPLEGEGGFGQFQRRFLFSMPTENLILYHIPVCPFSQRLQILLTLKGVGQAVEFRVVDITRPRDPAILSLSRGTTALPIMKSERGVLKESLVILRYLDELFPERMIAQGDPYLRAIENMLIAREGDFTAAGYRYVMNRDPARTVALRDAMVAQWSGLEDFLTWYNLDGTFLFSDFGLAEAVFTPMFVRFLFLDYFEDFELPMEGFRRVRRWRDACLAHPAAQQVSREEVVKSYYDYALGVGNGALPPGRSVSSFAFEPHWSKRPWPPRNKFAPATDGELGLLGD